ncbi:hypothetical protein SDC9_66498 [bioreactor metagenome]|uniref:Uncharacterized protein n=1 Tax=bioreactor metagenome TaxID=1076179 RepID=A0A644XWN2_9ZZZZ
MAITSENISAKAKVHGKCFTKSCSGPVSVNMNGKNAALMANVAISNGLKYSRALLMAECQREYPCSISSIYPSITTMELSTIIPRTTIRAASVTVFISIPSAYINAHVAAMEIGIPEAATRADFTGKSMSMTTITTRMENTRSCMNDCTESSTTFGRSVMR